MAKVVKLPVPPRNPPPSDTVTSLVSTRSRELRTMFGKLSIAVLAEVRSWAENVIWAKEALTKKDSQAFWKAASDHSARALVMAEREAKLGKPPPKMPELPEPGE